MWVRLFKGADGGGPSVTAAAEKLERVCAELLSTEASYVKTLETIVEVYARPLRAWAAESAADTVAALSPAEVTILFGSVETLLQLRRGSRCERQRRAPLGAARVRVRRAKHRLRRQRLDRYELAARGGELRGAPR